MCKLVNKVDSFRSLNVLKQNAGKCFQFCDTKLMFSKNIVSVWSEFLRSSYVVSLLILGYYLQKGETYNDWTILVLFNC
jgi:hypothetical protein